MTSIGKFRDMVAAWRVDAPSLSVADLLERVLTDSGYMDVLEAERTIESQGRQENLRELIGVAREFEARGEEEATGLSAFLQEISLYTDQDELDDERGRVTLMTLHNAKGLEFPVVFVIGLEEGLFPHQRSLDEHNEEEERRLCYVGMTRAQRELTLVYARSRTIFGARSFNLPSRFLDELPGEGVEWDRPQPAWSVAPRRVEATRAFRAPRAGGASGAHDRRRGAAREPWRGCRHRSRPAGWNRGRPLPGRPL